MTAWRMLALMACMFTAFAGSSAGGSTQWPVKLIASGLLQPADVAVAQGEPRRVYVAEQRGTIRIAVNGRTLARPFLDLRGLVRKSLLEGLFSVAFHPHYATDPRFYVDYVGDDRRLKVVEYRSRGGRALPGSARTVLDFDAGRDHFGGDLVFGKDGLLYVSVGDGSVAADAQDPESPRGKLLRLDVDAADVKPEVVALGLRNPWRFSFDRATNDLYIGDVGAVAWEEINYLAEATETIPNYGWNVYEARKRMRSEPATLAGKLTFPLVAYRHPRRACAAVIGGFVYRGRAAPRMRGRYVYGDLCNTRVWSVRVVNGRAVDRRVEPFDVPGGIMSFAEGLHGELYTASQAGRVYRLLG